MDFNLAQLNLILARMVEEYMQRGVESVQIDDVDEYWVVGSPEWTNFSQKPEPAVGSLSDDWTELQRLLKDKMPTAVDFDRLAAVLRAVSDQLVK